MKFSPYVTLLSTSSGVHKFSKNLAGSQKSRRQTRDMNQTPY